MKMSLKTTYKTEKTDNKIVYIGIVQVWMQIDAYTSQLIWIRESKCKRLTPQDAIIDAVWLKNSMLNDSNQD